MNINLQIVATTLAVGYLVYKGFKHKRKLYYVVKNIPRDLRDLRMYIQLIGSVLFLKVECGADLISKFAKKHPNKLALIAADTEKKLTFAQFEKLTNRISRYFYENHYEVGDAVGIQMENELEYIPLLNALGKIGVIGACINTKLTGTSLGDILDNGKCRLLIYHKDFEENSTGLEDIERIEISDFLEKCSKYSSEYLKKPCNWHKDLPVYYFFTSGTTGNPKPVPFQAFFLVKNYNLITGSIGLISDDVIYNVLPFYHLGGNALLASGMINKGATMVIRKKFQSSVYFKDCCRYNITVCGFVGEMCRYLLAEPSSKYDTGHKVRVITGNSIRKHLIPLFKKRFNIKKMCEYYGATEGNVGLFNWENKDGAVGHISHIIPNPCRIVQVNTESGEIARDAVGLAIECKPYQPGMLLGRITYLTPFRGYVSHPEAERKKVAHDVITKGDKYFISGDLLMRDEDGFVYFHDRITENFKWKGENISVTYMEDAISKMTSFCDVLVYRVDSPQGKIGMAYIRISEKKFKINALFHRIYTNLPTYLYPPIIKMGRKLSVTGTFKYQKNMLQNEGYNPRDLLEGEQLFYCFNQIYKEMTGKIFEEIMNGNIEF